MGEAAVAEKTTEQRLDSLEEWCTAIVAAVHPLERGLEELLTLLGALGDTLGASATRHIEKLREARREAAEAAEGRGWKSHEYTDRF